MTRSAVLTAAVVLLASGSTAAVAATEDASWSVSVQATSLTQYHPAFHSSIRGPNSLDPGSRGDTTNDATLFVGYRPWAGGEIWLNGELDDGFGLSNTLGAAGFPSGEAYKVGRNHPYFRMQRWFLRQTVDLGGTSETVAADQNVMAGHHTQDRLVLTAGRFSVADIFDTNRYAHDPRADFMNWAAIDTATFDYAADAWGYSWGGAAELWEGPWTLRGAVFDLSDVPNSKRLDATFGQFQTLAEVEHRHTLGGRPGAVRVTGFLTRGRMGHFADALRAAELTGDPPSTAAVRTYSSRGGVSVTVEQELADGLGGFLRAGVAGSDVEAYEFTDVDRAVAAGLSSSGARWGAPDDTVGLALMANMAGPRRLAYLAAGGLGILVGDGQLRHAGTEQIAEVYWKRPVAPWLQVTVDYQAIVNPAFNRDNGPVSVFGLRLHVQR